MYLAFRGVHPGYLGSIPVMTTVVELTVMFYRFDNGALKSLFTSQYSWPDNSYHIVSCWRSLNTNW